jgi:hypothetical protein
VVAAGEQSGALGMVLERLADDLEQRQQLRAKLLGAMLYPAIVSVIALVIVTFLVTYVVPQVATVFSSSKRALPGLTVAMLASAPSCAAGAGPWRWPCRGRQRHWCWRAAARPSANAATPLPARCRWWAGWRAATTRRASAARWRCWPVPACPS